MKALIKSALVCMMAIVAVGVSAQPPQGQRQQATPEERAKQRTEQLKKDLGLNETQEKQVYDLQLKMMKEMEAMRGSGQTDREKMRTEMGKRQTEMTAEMKKILTEDQFKKWEKQEAERRGNMRGRGQGGQRPQRQ